MKKLRGAVVGVGYLGRFHAQKYKTLAEKMKFDFVGVCDSRPVPAEAVAMELGVSSFSDPEKLLGKVDFVTIATTTTNHYEMASLFLRNGIHVNVEKPMTVTSDQAQKLIRLAEERNLVLTVGHSERFSPVFQALRLQMQNPLYFELQRHAPYRKRGADVSVVHDLMIHDLDLMLDLDSTAVEVVAAQGSTLISETLDWMWAQFSFQSGNKAFISVSRVSSQMIRTVKLVEKGRVLTGDFQTGDIETATPDDGEIIFSTEAVGKGDNLLLETKNFVGAIQKKNPALVPGQAGWRALKLAEDVIAKAGIRS